MLDDLDDSEEEEDASRRNVGCVHLFPWHQPRPALCVRCATVQRPAQPSPLPDPRSRCVCASSYSMDSDDEDGEVEGIKKSKYRITEDDEHEALDSEVMLCACVANGPSRASALPAAPLPC